MLTDSQLLVLGLSIANRAVISDIETGCVAVRNGNGWTWYDTRSMVDPREHASETLDMATDALAYAEASGLIRRHPRDRHMVRVLSSQP